MNNALKDGEPIYDTVGQAMIPYLSHYFNEVKDQKTLRKAFADLAQEQRIGDWLELPDGTTYRLVFKPSIDQALEQGNLYPR